MSIKHLNQRQLAERWGISEASLERWRSEGIGPLHLKIHGRVLYRLEDIEAYEVQCLKTSTSKRAVKRHQKLTPWRHPELTPQAGC